MGCHQNSPGRATACYLKGASMPADRIATVVPVAETDAKGKVAEIYDDIKEI